MRHRRSQTDGFVSLGIFGEGADAVWAQWNEDDGQVKWRSLYSPQDGYKTLTVKSTTQVKVKVEVQKFLDQEKAEKQRQLVLI